MLNAKTITVDKREGCVYVQIGDWTYYIDDSTNESIVMKWNTKDPDDSYYADWKVQD